MGVNPMFQKNKVNKVKFGGDAHAATKLGAQKKVCNRSMQHWRTERSIAPCLFVAYSVGLCIFGIKINDMIVERTNNQIVIKVSPRVDTFGFQRIMDYLEYLEITSKSEATQDDADSLADELNENWWSKNRKRFIK